MKSLWILALWGLSSCGPAVPVWEVNRDRVDQILQLSTVEMVFREVIWYGTEDRILDMAWRNNEVLFAIDMRVTAGFDLQEGYTLTPDADGGLTVEFPQPKILRVDADERTLEEYLTKGAPLGYLKLQGLFTDRHGTLKAEALAQGILDLARQRAVDFLRGLFSGLGVQRLRIRFREVNHEELP